jgi:hypothetical protein
MDSPLTQILADLWLQNIEQNFNIFTANKSIIGLRCVDDIFCIFSIPQIKVLNFHLHITNKNQNLNFTVEFESGILFLF